MAVSPHDNEICIPPLRLADQRCRNAPSVAVGIVKYSVNPVMKKMPG